VYVGNLDPMVTEQEIMQIFNSFGTVAGIDLPREGIPPVSRGFCFVEYMDQRMADLAIASLQDFMLAGRKLRVGRPTSQKRAASTGVLPAQVSTASSGPGVSGHALGGVGFPAPTSGPRAPTMQTLAPTPMLTLAPAPRMTPMLTLQHPALHASAQTANHL